MKKVLIFGISGFAGRYLSKELTENGYTVFGCDRRSSSDVECVDITDQFSVSKIISDVSPDYIVNLAAVSSVRDSWLDPELTFKINVGGSENILNAVLEQNLDSGMLFIGSSEEYAPSDIPLSEDMPLTDNNPYSRSKIEQERLIDRYRNEHGLRIKYARSFNHIGIGQDEKFVIPSWCEKIAAIKAFRLQKAITVGNVRIIRDFSDVRDVVHAYRLLLEDDSDINTYNVGSGKGLELYKILEFIISISEIAVSIDVDESLIRPSDIPVSICDNSLIKHQLSWVPKYDIWNTIKQIFDYYLNGFRS